MNVQTVVMRKWINDRKRDIPNKKTLYLLTI